MSGAMADARPVASAAPPAARALATLALAALAVALLAVSGAVRRLEAITASSILALLGTGAGASDTFVLVPTDVVPDGMVGEIPPGGAIVGGFRIALGCSVVLFLVPLLLVAAVAVASGRVRAPARFGRALGLGAAAVVVVSQLRYVVSGLLIHEMGQERGFGIAHVLLGSIISTVGLALATFGFAWIAIWRRDG